MKIDEIVDNALHIIYITADHNHATVDFVVFTRETFQSKHFFCIRLICDFKNMFNKMWKIFCKNRWSNMKVC